MMKMNLRILQILLFLVFPILLIGQTKKEKERVYNQLLELRTERSLMTSYRSLFDKNVVDFIDTLEKNGIDTIGIYHLNYIGSFSLDDCYIDSFEPKDIYVQWIENGLTYHENINSKCQPNPLQVDSSSIISFYFSNTLVITKSVIMPCITEIAENEIGMLSTSHDTRLTIYCRINKKEHFDFFWDNDLICKENLYYEENQNSIINQWMKEIDKQIEKVENQD